MTANKHIVRLPKRLNFYTLSSLLEDIYRHDAKSIDFDLSPCEFFQPIGVVSLSCIIELMKLNDTSVGIVNLHNNSSFYLNRMGFFECIDLKGPDDFRDYHSPDGRFSCLKKVGDDNDTDDITNSIVSTLGLEEYSDEWQTVSYIISELINNVCHHSGANGYALAQYYPNSNNVAISIGDCGIGLLNALKSSYYEEINCHGDAIKKSLEPLVTSNPPHFGQSERRNRGVGLSMVHRLVQESGGDFRIHSGTARLCDGDVNEVQSNWQGTLVEVRLERGKISSDISKIMQEMLKKSDSRLK